MKTIEIIPSAVLMPFIDKFLFISTEGFHFPYNYRVIPNGNPELFFSLDNTKCETNSRNYKLSGKEAYFVGLHDVYSASYLQMHSALELFIIVFKPMGVSNLLGIAESELANRIVDGEDLFGRKIHWIWEKLNHSGTIPQMVEIVESFLLKQVKSIKNSPREFSLILKKIQHQYGLHSVARLADSLNIHKRNLERSFEKNVGLSPWDYSRIFRLNYIFKLAMSGYDLLDIVFACGYYDQAHFAKDFKKMTEISPQQFIRTIPAVFYSKSYINRIYIPLPEQSTAIFHLPENLQVNTATF